MGQMVRFAPMSAPPMGDVRVFNYFFFVPERIVNPNWEKFITGYYQNPSKGSTFLTMPNLTFKLTGTRSVLFNSLFTSRPTGLKRINLLDYLGLRTADGFVPTSTDFTLSPILAFWKIYFEYFVNENIGIVFPKLTSDQQNFQFLIRVEDSGSIKSVDKLYTYDDFLSLVINGSVTIKDAIEEGGLINFDCSLPNILFLLTLPHRMWSKDYFTSALPWTQKGESVSVPLFDGKELPVSPVNGIPFIDSVSQGVQDKPLLFTGDVQNGFLSFKDQLPNGSSSTSVVSIGVRGQTVNLGDKSGLTINSLRTALKMQEWLERNARGGTRYIEQLRAHFGVKSSDARLQRPEYLGGANMSIITNTVMQTSASTDDGTPQGTMAGSSTTVATTPRFKFYAEEHGFIIGLSFVVPMPIYSDGINRAFLRRNFDDYYWPEFAHLGEQPVYRCELYNDDTEYETDVFGYQSRYAEYKNKRNEVHGDFLNELGMQGWLYGHRRFENHPKLTGEFLEVNPSRESSLNSMFPVVDGNDHIYVETYHKLNASRLMPKYGTPLL